MKKIIFASIILGGLAISSCNKERACDCTVSGQTISADLAKGKKSEQEDACKTIETTYKLADPAASCTLK
jgi:hypothetical protein